jgi:hypothetical protein
MNKIWYSKIHVVAIQLYLCDASIDKSLNLMQQHWFVGKLHQGLWPREREGAEARAIATH